MHRQLGSSDVFEAVICYITLNLALIGLILLQGCGGQFFVPSTRSTSPQPTFANFPSSVYCPAGMDGNFPDPTNCSIYVECQSGLVTFIHVCPRSLYWLPTGPGNGYCVSLNQAQCQSLDIPYPGYPVQSTTPYNTPFNCPTALTCNRTSIDGFYTDPANCSRYYLCADRRATMINCPTGMTWSERSGFCDWPYKTGCEAGRRPARNTFCSVYNAAAQVSVNVLSTVCLWIVTAFIAMKYTT